MNVLIGCFTWCGLPLLMLLAIPSLWRGISKTIARVSQEQDMRQWFIHRANATYGGRPNHFFMDTSGYAGVAIDTKAGCLLMGTNLRSHLTVIDGQAIQSVKLVQEHQTDHRGRERVARISLELHVDGRPQRESITFFSMTADQASATRVANMLKQAQMWERMINGIRGRDSHPTTANPQATSRVIPASKPAWWVLTGRATTPLRDFREQACRYAMTQYGGTPTEFYLDHSGQVGLAVDEKNRCLLVKTTRTLPFALVDGYDLDSATIEEQGGRPGDGSGEGLTGICLELRMRHPLSGVSICFWDKIADSHSLAVVETRRSLASAWRELLIHLQPVPLTQDMPRSPDDDDKLRNQFIDAAKAAYGGDPTAFYFESAGDYGMAIDDVAKRLVLQTCRFRPPRVLRCNEVTSADVRWCAHQINGQIMFRRVYLEIAIRHRPITEKLHFFHDTTPAPAEQLENIYGLAKQWAHRINTLRHDEPPPSLRLVQ